SLYVPGQGTIALPDVTSQFWLPNFATYRAPDGIEYRFVGEPRDFAPGARPKLRVVAPWTSDGSDLGLQIVSEATVAESSTDITVPGEVLAPTAMAGTGTTTVYGQIRLITVKGKRVSMTTVWSDTNNAGTTVNSRNQLIPSAPIVLG